MTKASSSTRKAAQVARLACSVTFASRMRGAVVSVRGVAVSQKLGVRDAVMQQNVPDQLIASDGTACT